MQVISLNIGLSLFSEAQEGSVISPIVEAPRSREAGELHLRRNDGERKDGARKGSELYRRLKGTFNPALAAARREVGKIIRVTKSSEPAQDTSSSPAVDNVNSFPSQPSPEASYQRIYDKYLIQYDQEKPPKGFQRVMYRLGRSVNQQNAMYDAEREIMQSESETETAAEEKLLVEARRQKRDASRITDSIFGDPIKKYMSRYGIAGGRSATPGDYLGFHMRVGRYILESMQRDILGKRKEGTMTLGDVFGHPLKNMRVALHNNDEAKAVLEAAEKGDFKPIISRLENERDGLTDQVRKDREEFERSMHSTYEDYVDTVQREGQKKTHTHMTNAKLGTLYTRLGIATRRMKDLDGMLGPKKKDDREHMRPAQSGAHSVESITA